MLKVVRLIKTFIFLCLLFFALFLFNKIFSFKYLDGIYGMKVFYKLPKNSVEVLVLGSSHAYQDINPAVLYTDYGITAFDLAGSIQPMWNTYYYLCEALRSQSPKVIVLEVYGTVFPEDYNDESRIIKNTYGMSPTLRYYNAMKVSAPKEEFWDYFLRYTRYHNRYTSLSKNDFLPNQGMDVYKDWKGFGNNTGHNSYKQPDVSNITGHVPMTEKTERYYRSIIELCLEKKINLEIIVTPYNLPPNHQRRFNYASNVAAEYGIPFTNFNNIYEEFEFDFSLDMADGHHANQRGNIKITRYLGKILNEKYSFNDNRNIQKYASWQRNADYYWQSISDL